MDEETKVENGEIQPEEKVETPETPETPEASTETPSEGTVDFSEQFSKLNEEINSIKESLSAKAPPPGDESFDPKDWNDVFSKVEELAEKKYQAIEQERQAKIEEAKAEEARINAEFDRQLDLLRKDGKLPKVNNPEDDNDPGVKAQKEIFALGVKYKSTDLIAMADLRDQLKKKPEGAEAPVGSSSQTTGATQQNFYDPTKSLDQLTAEFKKSL